MHWNYRRYGSASDPIHKSHLIKITGDYGCPREFWYSREQPRQKEEQVTPGYAALGTATHEVIASMLSSPQPVNERIVRELLLEWLHTQAPLRWAADDDREALIAERVAMVLGLLRFVDRYVAQVVACESAFIAPFAGYWLCGHVDLIFVPARGPSSTALAITDWKTGAQKPHALELAHGWEGGVYSAALRYGYFEPRLGRPREELEAELMRRATLDPVSLTPTYGVHPHAAYQVHLADYVPYARAGSRLVRRPEDLAHFGYTEPTKHAYTRGDLRGGAWMPVELHEHDLPRLAHRLRQVVSTVRMGRFYDRVGERCTRCSYARDCLNDGYQLEPTADLVAIARMGIEDDRT